MNCEPNTLSIPTFVVLTLTLGAIIWYTIVARDQLKELVRQRRLSVVATLVPQVKHDNGSYVFYLTNIGKGIALNIRIKDVKYYPDTHPDWYYRFDEIPMIRPADTEPANIVDIQDGVENSSPTKLFHLKKQILPSKISNVNIEMFFQDIEGGNYRQVYQMGDANKQYPIEFLEDRSWYEKFLFQFKFKK